ncbi:MAG: thymidine phosphorylase, partial [Alcanivoracaceae bacterium]
MKLKAIRMGIDTHQEFVVYIRADAAVVRAEGFTSSVRVMISDERQEAIATLNVVDADRLEEGCVGMSNALWDVFDPEHDVAISHAPVVSSMS